MEIDSILPSTFNKKSINCAKNVVQFQSNRVENFLNNKQAGWEKNPKMLSEHARLLSR